MNIKKWTIGIASGVAMFSLTVTSALATVTFNPNTGVGFVEGKDFKKLWDWKKRTFLEFASGVTFSLDTNNTFAVACHLSDEREVGISLAQEAIYVVSSEVKLANNEDHVDGLSLTGKSVQEKDIEDPTVNDNCRAEGLSGVVTTVNLISSQSQLFMYSPDFSQFAIWDF